MDKVIILGVFTLGVVIGWEAHTIKSKWELGSNMYNGMFSKEDYNGI